MRSSFGGQFTVQLSQRNPNGTLGFYANLGALPEGAPRGSRTRPRCLQRDQRFPCAKMDCPFLM